MARRLLESENEYVEELKRSIQTWKNLHLAMENERNAINQGYLMVKKEKDELEEHKKALEAEIFHLLKTQTDKKTEISTLRGEIGTLNQEVDRLKAEVVKLNTPWWQKYRTKSANMQTLLEDLNNLRE